MTVTYFNGIVVGYDGSHGSELALEWAADEAQRRDLTLHVIHVWEPPPMLASPYGPRSVPESETVLQEAVLRARKVAPDIGIAEHALPAPVSLAFVDASIEADTVVLGAHGRRRRRSDMGSTAWQVAIHALSPVVIVRGAREDLAARRSVVAGVDGSSLSDQALEYAFRQASRRQAPLVVVHGWHLESVAEYYADLRTQDEGGGQERERRQEIDRWTRPWRRAHPDVDVRTVAVRRHPVNALLHESADAQLLVVGSRGRGGFRGLALGSVGFDLMRAVDCPLAIVRPTGR